jgi:N-acetylmuramoyl-L-alanine amidase
MRKLIISAGHSCTLRDANGNTKNIVQPDRGAVSSSGTYIEGDLTANFRKKLCNDLNEIGVKAVVDRDDSVLANSLRFFKSLVSANDIAIEFHFNSSSSTLATGTEVLIPQQASKLEKQIGSDIAHIISVTLGIKDRGIKTELDSHHTKLGWLNKLNCENFIVEICFISNFSDLNSFLTTENRLSKQLSNYLKQYINETN